MASSSDALSSDHCILRFEKVIAMSESATYNNCHRMTIPAKPSSVFRSLGMRNPINVELRRNGGTRSWPLKMMEVTNREYNVFSKGWKLFARDNNVREGDTLRFAVLTRTKFTVDIDHKCKERGCRTRGVRIGPKRGFMESPHESVKMKKQLQDISHPETASLREKKPLFLIEIHAASCTTLKVPEAFSMALPKPAHEASLECGCWRRWHVREDVCCNDPILLLTRVWMTFVLDHGLEVGDLCILELKDSNTLRVQAYVYKAGMGKPLCPMMR